MFPLYCSRQCVQGEARLASIFLGLCRVLLRCRVCVRLRSRFVLRHFRGCRGFLATCGVKASERRVQRVWRWCLGATVVVRCCAVFVAVIFCCYRGCVPGWLRGARFLASLTVRVVFTYAFPCE